MADQVHRIHGNDMPARLSPASVEQLFVRGDLPGTAPVAIVGTRRPTPYGRLVANQLGTRLGEAGIPLVSGLAFGIDTIAHRAVIEAGGHSIAVLPGGVDDASISPQTNRRLAEQVLKGGALVSEYPVGTAVRKEHYHQRNRVIAGFADVVVVIEADIPSGTLITARHAADLSRDLWSLPGPITSPTSQGTNRLIAEGAKPLINLDAFCKEVGIKPQRKRGHPLLAHLGDAELSIDELITLTSLPAQQIELELTTLELKGVIRRSAPGKVVRA